MKALVFSLAILKVPMLLMQAKKGAGESIKIQSKSKTLFVFDVIIILLQG
jgi:hypothetical protein